jgi:hypothetical protein
VPSFFFTNNIKALQGQFLGRINPLSNNSWSWIFSPASLLCNIIYGDYAIGAIPRKVSIEISTSLIGGNLDGSFEKILRNSLTTGILSNSLLLFQVTSHKLSTQDIPS